MIDGSEQNDNKPKAKLSFVLPVRVYIEDTDAGGIVFYANYLKYFERARTEFIRFKGYELRSSLAENISFVVHSLDIKYLKPAKLDDLVQVTVELQKMGKTFFIFRQQVLNEDGLCLVEGHVKVACVHLDTAKPRTLPESLAVALKKD